MIGTLDSQVIEKFKEFQEKSGKYSDLVIEDVQFEKKFPFIDDENIILVGSKNIASHEELARINDKNGLPVYDASPNINTYVDENKFLDQVFEVENNNNPDISFASEGNSSAGTNFIIHQNKYFVNNHRTVMKFTNKYYSKYIYYNIFNMKEKYGFKRGYTPSQKELKRLEVMIPIPQDYNEKYRSIDIQRAVVDFLEYSFENIQKIKENIDTRYKIATKMKKSLINSTFQRNAIKNTFNTYAKRNNINFEITDVKFNLVPFDDFFELLSLAKKIKATESKRNGLYPVISQAEAFINGYYNSNDGIINASTNPVILFGDHTTILKYIDFDFLAGADGTKVLRCKESIFPKYAYYQSFGKVKAQGYQRHFQYLKEKEFLVPESLDTLSSIEIQQILSAFIEQTDKEIDEKYFKKYNRLYKVIELLRETYLKRTFNKIAWN